MFRTLDRAVTDLRRSKAIECGQIADTKNLFGEWKIEPRELQHICTSLADSADKVGAHTPAAADAPTLEAEIAALIEEAGESLRSPDYGHWDIASAFQRVAADSNNAGERSALLPNNIEFEVKEPCLERRGWDLDIRINDPARAMEVAKSSDARRIRTALVIATLSGALAIGWVVGVPVEQRVHSSGQVLGSKSQTIFDGPEASRAAPPEVSGHRFEPTKSPAPQSSAAKTSSVAQQSIGPSEPAASGSGRLPKILPRPMPFPETRPRTIEGWTVHDVVGGTAILEGPDGIRKATHGDTVPGVGRVEFNCALGRPLDCRDQ